MKLSKISLMAAVCVALAAGAAVAGPKNFKLQSSGGQMRSLSTPSANLGRSLAPQALSLPKVTTNMPLSGANNNFQRISGNQLSRTSKLQTLSPQLGQTQTLGNYAGKLNPSLIRNPSITTPLKPIGNLGEVLDRGPKFPNRPTPVVFPDGKPPIVSDPNIPFPGGKPPIVSDPNIPFPGGKPPIVSDPNIPFPGGKPPIVDPINDPPVNDPGQGGGGDPPADPCPPQQPCPPKWCGGGWGYPIPFPFPVGGGFGGYCPPTTVVQPVYLPAQPAVAEAPQVVDAMVDLELVEVRQLDRGNAAKQLGPAFRIAVRNKSGAPVVQQFNVALAASLGRQATAESAFAVTRVAGLEAGEVLSIDVRLPVKAMSLGKNADGQSVPYAFLTAVADSHMELATENRDDDALMLARAEIVMVAVK